ncbi:armadillo-type protein [Geopyxis carbonaria]|nr:armadillo-type protein [Geopyxis carbonaria]
MTRSAEESLFVSLLSQLSQSSEPEAKLSALRAIKHRLIGHDQNKELFVRLGIAVPLSATLGSHGERLDDAWSEARVEAGVAVGSLAYGGESYVLHLISAGILPRLTESLDPATSPPKLILSSLRTLNTMLDTYIGPDESAKTTIAITEAIYTPGVLRCLRTLLSQTASDSLCQQQIALAASLVAKSCAQSIQIVSSAGSESYEAAQQKLLVDAGVLDALATKLGSFCVTDHAKSNTGDAIPPPAPHNASLAPILDAIAAIIQGSKLRSIEFLFSPTLLAIFPPGSSESKSEAPSSGGTSTFLPRTGSSSNLMQAPQQIITPQAFPPLSAATSSGGFPSLTSHILLGNVGTVDDSEGSTGGDTPLRRRGETVEAEDDDRHRTATLGRPDYPEDIGIEVEETGLINWLMSKVRSGNSITILSSASVIANLYLVGLIPKKLLNVLGLVVIPVLARLLNETDTEQRKTIDFGFTGVGGVDAQTWYRWQVEEKTPAVLSRLLLKCGNLQKAAVEAGAIKKLAAMLKTACESPVSAANGVNDDSAHTLEESANKTNPLYNHRMRVKEGTLRCIANIGLFRDEYRKAIIDSGVVVTIVSSCLKPMKPIESSLYTEQTNSEGNLPPVLIAACSVTRSLSRSVSILRTSLIDAGVAVPLFNLLHHPDLNVTIAASASVCNLVLDFSPMRRPILEAGAVDMLCKLSKSEYHSLKLNALWALKHLVLDADSATKKRSFEGLTSEFLMKIISVPHSDEDDEEEEGEDEEDEEMDDPESNPNTAMEDSIGSLRPGTDASHTHLPPKAAAAVRLLQRRENTSPVVLAKSQAVSLQEQGLEYIRNLLCGHEVVSMIDFLFSHIDPDRLLSLLETLLNTPNQAGEIVNAVVYVLIHLAAGATKHRTRMVERPELMRCLLDLWNYHIVDVRSGIAWILINLTWAEDGDEAEGVRHRINALRELGWPERLKEMRKDNELDVKERVKTAEFQLGIGAGAGRT